MSMVYLNEKLAELRAVELERDARLAALRAEACRSVAADRTAWHARLVWAWRLLPARTPGWAR